MLIAVEKSLPKNLRSTYNSDQSASNQQPTIETRMRASTTMKALTQARGALRSAVRTQEQQLGGALFVHHHSTTTTRESIDPRSTMPIGNHHYPTAAASVRSFSSAAPMVDPYSSFPGASSLDGPTGTIFTEKIAVLPDLIGKTAAIQRTFGPRSNAEGLLAVGGAELAAQSSFDPNYHRAQEWIRHHAVGPARLSPILISGLTGALTEAAFPHAIVVAQSMTHRRPLIVGVTVTASIQVVDVTRQAATKPSRSQQFTTTTNSAAAGEEDAGEEEAGEECKLGYRVSLKTAITRVRDDAVIAEGTHELWIPDYLNF